MTMTHTALAVWQLPYVSDVKSNISAM